MEKADAKRHAEVEEERRKQESEAERLEKQVEKGM